MTGVQPVAPVVPEVTVVIPCFNTHEYLGQAIDSIRRQSFQPIEIIVVDDGSTNVETVEFLDGLGDGVKLIRQPNKGLPAARNVGFAAAGGRFLLPLDADDWLEPTAVEKLVNQLLQKSEASFAFCHIRMEGEGYGVLAKNYNFFEQLFLNQLPYCLMFPKEVWRRAGGYDEGMRRGYEDWEFNIRLGSLGYFGAVVSEPLFHYRIAQSGMLIGTSNKIHGEIWEGIRRKHSEIYRFGRLLTLWRFWRKRPSTYPLFFYFAWWAAAVVLPKQVFAALFRAMRNYSHGRRVMAATSRV